MAKLSKIKSAKQMFWKHFHQIIGMRLLKVHTSADRLAPVEEVVDIAGFLVVDTENWPQTLYFPFALMWICRGC